MIACRVRAGAPAHYYFMIARERSANSVDRFWTIFKTKILDLGLFFSAKLNLKGIFTEMGTFKIILDQKFKFRAHFGPKMWDWDYIRCGFRCSF